MNQVLVSNVQPQINDVMSKATAYLTQAKQDMAQIKDIAGTASKKLGDMANSFLKDLQGGY